MVILALNKATVKLITSTQIITSVSSVVKELVENSLDADAKNIEINLTDNGLSSIEIRDDGCGISIADVPNMAMPHYTSKILDFADLYSLTTYGFRGEALNAICRVANVTITTKTMQDETAKVYIMDNEGGINKTELSHRFVGTTVKVGKLFENLPVRRQMISNPRKSKLEIKYIESLLKSLSICQPVVRMSLTVNNTLVFLKPSCGSVKEAMSHFIGSKIAANLEWIYNEDCEVKLQLMIPKQDLSESQLIYEPNEQFMIVNNRPVRYKQLEKIIQERISDHFGIKVPSKRRLVYLLSIMVAPSEIDVNLEPNKTSVLLKNEDIISKKLDKILVDYYNLRDENMKPNASVHDTSIDRSLEYLDFTSNIVGGDEISACKKIKLNNNKQKARDFNVDVEPDFEIKRKAAEKRSLNIMSPDINSSMVVTHNFQDMRMNPWDSREQNESKADGEKPTVFGDKNNLDRILETFSGPVLSDSDDSEINSTDNISRKPQQAPMIIGHAMRSTNAEIESIDSSAQKTMIHSDDQETLSQLPVVDLGEDFDIESILERSRENQVVKSKDVAGALENCVNNVEMDRSETDSNINSIPRSNVSLELWSRGQIPGLKNPTEVTVLNDPKNSNKSKNGSQNKEDSNSQTIYHTGFSKFSYEIRSQVLEENPNAALPLIGKILANRWKELSPEERGYYRDLALEEKKNAEVEKKKTRNTQLSQKEADKNKARLIQMLESMKKTKSNKKYNINERTTTTWDINIQNITKCFFAKSRVREDRIIGALTDEIWSLKCNGKVCVVNSGEIFESLDADELKQQQMSGESTASILQSWLSKRSPNSAVIMHQLHTISSAEA